MRFDDHQQELLSSILDSLLCYINGRFHIVRDMEPDKESERQIRSQLIERYLWEHRELIGEFVRDNPDNLPPSQLDIAQDLEGTLYGTLYLESRGQTSAVIAHNTGIYTVASPNESFFGQFPEGLLEMRGAIAPFCGIIVPIPPFSVMGSVSTGHLSHLHDDLRKRGAERPTDDAGILAKRARAWQRHPSFVDDSAPKDPRVAAPGYHEGPLSGLEGEKRRQAMLAHANQVALDARDHEHVLATLSLSVNAYPNSLKDALGHLDEEWVRDIALDLCDQEIPSSLPTHLLVHMIEQHIVQSVDDLVLALTWCPDEQFNLFLRLMTNNPLPLDALSPSVASHLYPMIPFTFIFQKDGETRAWMPPETSMVAERVNLSSIRIIRNRLREARMAARGMATMCGIISVADLYERYRSAVNEPLSLHQFESVLEEYEHCESRDDYALWRHLGRDYVISVELSDASACARVTRESYMDCVIGSVSASGSPDDPLIVGIATENEDEFLRLVKRKEDELERMRLSLLKLERPKLAPNLPKRMLLDSPIQALMELDALKALRLFVDAHIPNDQDEYEFAELFCRSVIVSAVLMCESYNETMDIIRLYHMQACEGSTFSDTLGRLVTNAYNALPRWDLNGWSLEQNTERFTGKRRFFNADGTEQIVGDNEPCPCGSGKSYGRCCGHLC